MYLQILLFVALAPVLQAEVFHINDRQNSDCHLSNLCERNLSLNCEDKNDKNPTLTFSADSKDHWDSICSSFVGSKGKSTSFTINGAVFEVREICTVIQYVQVIDVAYLYDFGGTKTFQVKDVPQTTGKHTICIKKATDKHIVVQSVTLQFRPQEGKKMKVTLSFLACGDNKGTGVVNRIPRKANLHKPSATNRKRGHGECADEQELTYKNREVSMISFSDGLTGNNKKLDNALEGSGKTYTGKIGKNIRFIFTKKGSTKKFAWWRVCFLVRYASKITYEMEGDVHKWIQSIDVCDPQSFLWKCYYPWGHFDEIQKGSILLEPEQGSNTPIVVQEMSINICLDIQFSGDILRIGKATSKCKPAANKTDICDDTVRIQHSDIINFQSPFDLSTSETKRNTSEAWKILNPKKRAFEAKHGQTEIFFIYTLRKNCSLLNDNRFQARVIQFWAQNVDLVVAKFCDIGYPDQTNPMYCKSEKFPFAIWTNPSHGESVYLKNSKAPQKPKKFVINNWFVSTGVKIWLRSSGSEPMKIWNFNIFACCSPKFTERSLKGRPDVAEDPRPSKVTGDACVHLLKLNHKSRRDFHFNDEDSKRAEIMALQGSDQTYTGAPGKDVYFYIKAKDGNNFEWWKVCGRYFNVHRITYIMETSTVTYVQSKTFCGNDVWSRTCFYPQNQGIYVNGGVVKLEVQPGKTIQVKGLDMEGCRDHYNFKYNFHVHPCDYKALVIDTPRNQTLSIYAQKDKEGKWMQTELYHFTDHTGNDGDNTWFTLEPEHHLVSAIWTNSTFISLAWDIRKRRVVFDVTITSTNNVHTKILMLDLKELKNVAFNATINKLQSQSTNFSEHCIALPFKVKQCIEGQTLIAKCTVKTNESFVVPARYVHNTKLYEFILPKEAFGKNGRKMKERCVSHPQVMETECAKHAIMNRVQHQFLCDKMKQVLGEYDTLKNLERSRVYQACQLTYKTLRWVCEAMTDRPKSDRAFFFTNACTTKVKLTTTDIYQKFFRKTTNVEVTPEALDLDQRTIVTDPPTHTFNLRKQLPNLTVSAKGPTFAGITTEPKRLPKKFPDPYKVCVHYQCLIGNLEEFIGILTKPYSTLKTCINLTTTRCCVEMPSRTDLAIGHSLIISYFETEKQNIPKRIEELIPTV